MILPGRIIVDVVDDDVDGEGAEALGGADDGDLDGQDAGGARVGGGGAERVAVERSAGAQHARGLVDVEQCLVTAGQHGEPQLIAVCRLRHNTRRPFIEIFQPKAGLSSAIADGPRDALCHIGARVRTTCPLHSRVLIATRTHDLLISPTPTSPPPNHHATHPKVLIKILE